MGALAKKAKSTGCFGSRSKRRLPELPADPVVASLPAPELRADPVVASLLAPASSCLPIVVPVALLLSLGFLLVRRFTKPGKPYAEQRPESSEPKDLEEVVVEKM